MVATEIKNNQIKEEISPAEKAKLIRKIQIAVGMVLAPAVIALGFGLTANIDRNGGDESKNQPAPELVRAPQAPTPLITTPNAE